MCDAPFVFFFSYLKCDCLDTLSTTRLGFKTLRKVQCADFLLTQLLMNRSPLISNGVCVFEAFFKCSQVDATLHVRIEHFLKS